MIRFWSLGRLMISASIAMPSLTAFSRAFCHWRTKAGSSICLVVPSTSAKQAFWAGCPYSTMRIIEITADLLCNDASEPNGFHLNMKQTCQCAGVMSAPSLCPFCAFAVKCLLESAALDKNHRGKVGSHSFKVSLDFTWCIVVAPSVG